MSKLSLTITPVKKSPLPMKAGSIPPVWCSRFKFLFSLRFFRLPARLSDQLQGWFFPSPLRIYRTSNIPNNRLFSDLRISSPRVYYFKNFLTLVLVTEAITEKKAYAQNDYHWKPMVTPFFTRQKRLLPTRFYQERYFISLDNVKKPTWHPCIPS